MCDGMRERRTPRMVRTIEINSTIYKLGIMGVQFI